MNIGDEIYPAWSNPYPEPALSERRYEKGLCSIAEELQPKLTQFKMNYRDLELAKEKTDALRKTTRYFQGV